MIYNFVCKVLSEEVHRSIINKVQILHYFIEFAKEKEGFDS
jgi:hypothetical protein